MKFKEFNLDSKIKHALSDMGYSKPLKVQIEAIPKILDGKDLIIQSQTGSGKTSAFGIPICEKIDVSDESTQALVLTPTRELALQVKQEMEEISKYKGLVVLDIVGKESMKEQRIELKSNPHIVVGTVGRIFDHIKNKNINLKGIKYLVIDEADEMLIMGFKEELENIIAKIPKKRQTLMLSATINQQTIYISEQFMNSLEKIIIEADVDIQNKIEQIYYAVDGLKKSKFLKQMLTREDPKKAIIFLNTREQVDTLYNEMKRWDYYVTVIHGGIEQSERKKRFNEFKKGKYRILLSTDLASRGLHVHDITHVINYGVPFEHEQYIHRIGRTGRVDKNGIAITLVTSRDFERFSDLQNYLGYTIPCKGGHLQKPNKQIVATRKNRFKVDNTRKDKVTLTFNVGRLNSRIRSKDILNSFANVNGVSRADIGKITIGDKTSLIEVYGGKENLLLKAFNNKKINNKNYKLSVKKGKNSKKRK